MQTYSQRRKIEKLLQIENLWGLTGCHTKTVYIFSFSGQLLQEIELSMPGVMSYLQTRLIHR